MKLLVIGINHKTAPIALREQLAFSDGELPTALSQLKQLTEGSVIVSTCNRTEIYALVPDSLSTMSLSSSADASLGMDIGIEPNTQPHQLEDNQSIALKRDPRQSLDSKHPYHIDHAHHSNPEVLMASALQQIKSWLSDYKSISLSELEPYLYIHKDNQAITHWIRVASGLDSMILGEPQILGQIKQAVSKSLQNNSVSNKLNWVIDQVFSSAKQVRHDTQVGSQAVTLGFATAKLATQIFDDLSQCSLLVVASGEMNRLVSSHIAGLGIGQIMICNRNLDRAEQLASDLRLINPTCKIEVKPFPELAECLPNADIVSSCSGSMQALIDFKMTKKAVKKRRYRPMLMVDLAVPRDIEEKVSRLDEVYLYSIDDLQHVIAGNLEQRRQAAVDAELLVSHLVVEIERRFQVKQVGGDIQAYRKMAIEHADRLLAESLYQLQQDNASYHVNKNTTHSNTLNDKGKRNDDQNKSASPSSINSPVGSPIENMELVEAVMTELTRKLTQTLIHAPSKLMRKVASDGDNDTLDLVVETLTDYRTPANPNLIKRR